MGPSNAMMITNIGSSSLTLKVFSDVNCNTLIAEVIMILIRKSLLIVLQTIVNAKVILVVVLIMCMLKCRRLQTLQLL